MKPLFSPFRTTNPSGSRNSLRGIEIRILSVGARSPPRPRRQMWRQALWLAPPFGMHNEALVGGVACGLRSKSLQELLGHVGGPVLGVDAEPEGEVGAEDHC